MAKVTAVQVTAGGTGYTSAPSVEFTGGDGSGARGTAKVDKGKVVNVMIDDGGDGYNSAPSVAFNGGGGSGATGTATVA